LEKKKVVGNHSREKIVNSFGGGKGDQLTTLFVRSSWVNHRRKKSRRGETVGSTKIESGERPKSTKEWGKEKIYWDKSKRIFRMCNVSRRGHCIQWEDARGHYKERGFGIHQSMMRLKEKKGWKNYNPGGGR